MDRRHVLQGLGAGITTLSSSASRAFTRAGPAVQWWSSTQARPWMVLAGPPVEKATPNFMARDVVVGEPAQEIQGMGGAFSELGWQAISALPPARRAQALGALFGPGGAAFTLCRTPIGANDFSRDWYSYDEVDGDFELHSFSTARDRESLMPFIKAAQALNPELRFWASPWSPPTWMKTNRHYAQGRNFPGMPDNGIADAQLVREGSDGFIQDDSYFSAYAGYFRRFVEDYAREGIRIDTVMPQNEFNSAQGFPSCCWTPVGLARFIPHLAREMRAVDVDIVLGTLERANARLAAAVLDDPVVGPLLKGVGLQWAGKGAIDDLKRGYPQLSIWATEQECGTGTNDWHYARYGWSLMKRYLNGGASVWQYWNMALPQPGKSTWGWAQNALVSVDVQRGTFVLTPDYWVMKHLSSRVRPSARFLPTSSMSGFENQLAFRNPDGEVVIVIHNEMAQSLKVNIVIGDLQVAPVLPADSFNTLAIPSGAFG